MAPLVYVLMPWRTNECDLKAYSLIDFAITLPDGLTLIDFEVAMSAAWTELGPTHHVHCSEEQEGSQHWSSFTPPW